MPPPTPIPRFLLPQRSAIWRYQSIFSQSLRHASNKPLRPGDAIPKTSSKPIVLEKPTKFNPPSHGQRLRKATPRYGPDLTHDESVRHKTKRYPNMFPPQGTFMHWFLTSKGLHVCMTLGVLFILASSVSINNFQRNSPFADMLPPWHHLFIHPIRFVRTVTEVLKLHTAHRSEIVAEKRQHLVDDVQKRATYRRAHGLDMDEIFGWTTKKDAQVEGEGGTQAQGAETVQKERKKPLKKWLGIW